MPPSSSRGVVQVRSNRGVRWDYRCYMVRLSLTEDDRDIHLDVGYISS